MTCTTTPYHPSIRRSSAAISTTVAVVGPMANYPRCPVCGSYEVSRHTEVGRVWFSCRRCGITF